MIERAKNEIIIRSGYSEGGIRGVFRDNLIWICVITFALLILGEVLGDSIPFPNMSFFGSGFEYTFNLYSNFLGIWIVFIGFIFFFKRKNGYILDVLRYENGGNNVKMLLYGFLLGFVLNAFCAGVAFLHNDFKLDFYKVEPVQLILLLLVVFVQSGAEEFVCRGFMYERLCSRYGSKWLAIITNSVFFAVLHLGNEGISILGFVDLLVAGIFFSMLVYYYDSLWMAIACHTAWNFTQNIIFGLPNSGALSEYSIFMARKGTLKSSFAFDSTFGLEGTLLAVSVMAAACIGLYICNSRAKAAKPD